MNKRPYFSFFLSVYPLILLILPFSWWNNNLYMLGGDDIKIEYLNPSLYINAIINSNIINNAESESILIQDISNVPYFIFLFTLAKILPFLNLQLLVYGGVLSVSFFGFYWMSKKMPGINNQGTVIDVLIRFTVANMYAFSSFAIFSLWDHQLHPFIYVATLPIIFGMFLRSALKFSLAKCLVVAILITISPSFYSNLPWLIPILMSGLPFFLCILLNSPKSFFATSIVITVISIALVFTIPLTIFSFKSYSSGMFLSDVVAGSVRAFLEVNSDNSSMNFFALIPPHQFIFSRLWIFREMPTIFFIILYLTVIFVSLLFISLVGTLFIKNKLIKNNILLGVLLSYLLSFILYAGGSKYILEILANGMSEFPIFIMFRNNYDKFSLAVSLYSCIFLLYGLIKGYSILNNIKKPHNI